VDTLIKDYINSQTIISLSVIKDESPYSFAVFYSYYAPTQTIVFKSSPSTMHAQCLLKNAAMSGCINSADTTVANLQGLQFTGNGGLLDETEKELISNYIAKFPFSVFKSGEYWKCQLNWVKFTNNKLGFGTKKIWERK